MADQQSSLSTFRADAAGDAGGGEGGADENLQEAKHVTEGEERGELVDLSDHRFPDADGTVDLFVTQVDYTVEGYDDDEYPVLHVFGRTADREVEHVRVFDFEPYFFTPLSDLDYDDPEDRPLRESDFEDDRLMEERIAGLETRGDRDPSLDDAEAEEVVRHESIRGEELVKVYGQTPRDVGQLRDRFEHYEADILFPNRLLIDKDIRSGVRVPVQRTEDGSLKAHHEQLRPVEMDVEPRVCTFDIEVDDRSGFPEDGEETIVCLTSHDSYDDRYVVWLYESPDGIDGPEVLDDYEPIGADFEADVRVFDDEARMLEAFITYVEGTDPDVLTGWNFSDFDAPYLLDRLDVLDVEIDRLSRVNEVWRSDWQGPDVKGRVVFDLLYAYKRTQFTELESYRLDAVGEKELGVGKERYSGDIGDLWEQDPERLLEYNLRDVELCVELDEKQDIIAFWNDVRTFVGCLLEDAPTPGDVVDMYLLHEVHGRFALPSKGQQETEEFEGGAVFEPVSGVKEMVSVLDLKSLYPMCMVTINASPETKVDPDTYDGDTYRAPNGQHFRTEPDGVMREMVDDLLSERDELKGLRDEHEPNTLDYERFDRQQQAVKVIMNSLYGVSGWDRFRLYDKENAAAITATGRRVIEFTEEAVNEMGHEVTYGDTDSVMLSLGDLPVEGAIDASFEIEEYVNGRYGEFAAEELNADSHRLQIEFEKLYRRFFQAGKKKRYAGHIVWKEGKEVDDIDITGFEYKRSDIAPITKEVQHQVIQMIVTGEPLADVEAYVRDVIEDYEAGNVDPEEVGIPGGIGKRLDNYDTDTAHVRGAKYANLLLGTNFQRGSKPKRLYLSNVHADFFERVEAERGLSPSTDPLYGEFKREAEAGEAVICFEYADQVPPEFEIDWDKMLDKTLKGPIARILEALDVTWEEVKTGQEQAGLSSFT